MHADFGLLKSARSREPDISNVTHFYAISILNQFLGLWSARHQLQLSPALATGLRLCSRVKVVALDHHPIESVCGIFSSCNDSSPQNRHFNPYSLLSYRKSLISMWVQSSKVLTARLRVDKPSLFIQLWCW